MKTLTFLTVFLCAFFTSFGQNELSKKEVSESKKLIKSLKEKIPTSSYTLDFIYFDIAYEYEKLNEIDSAISYYLKVIELDPKSYSAYNNLGLIETENGNYEKALYYCNKAVDYNPSVKTYYNRGILYFDKEEYIKAINDFNIALEIDPNDKESYHFRGRSLFLNEDFSAALEDINKYFKISNELDEFDYIIRGRIFYYLSQYKNALKDLNKSIEIESEYIPALHYRAFTKTELKDHKGAIKDLNKIIELEPNHGYWYYCRAFDKKDLNDADGACDDWVKASSLGDEDAIEAIQEYCNE